MATRTTRELGTPLALGVGAVGRAFHGLSRVESWARRLAGVLLVVIGVRQSLVHVFGLPVP
jgi:threonine/homoserine/homoserine lactone efflux protein